VSDSIWWPDEAWFERKALPLGFITLSFRQLVTITFSFLVAFVASLPFEFAIAGASFGGRAAVFCIIFGVGYMISSRRVKLLPIELQAFYYLRTEGMNKVRMKLNLLLGPKKHGAEPPTEKRPPPAVQEISVEDFKNPIPLIVSDTVKGIQKETRALLFLDEQARGEDLVSPQRPRYRLTYVPLQDDVGKHLLTVRLDGSAEPLVSVDLLVQGRSAEAGEPITKVK
jgi:hypothetical protein